MRTRFGVSKILLATDDAAVNVQSKGYTNWTFINVDDKIKSQEYGNYRKQGQDGLEVMRVIDSLSRANFFIGTFSSCFGRVIYQLGRSRGNFLQVGHKRRAHAMMRCDVMRCDVM